jgi:membrane protease YdiL (CAAX protease family)
MSPGDTWRDRHNVVALAVGGISVAALALFGSSGPARGPGVGLCLAVCVLLFAFLVPAVQSRIKDLLLTAPSVAVWIPVGFGAYGVASSLAFGTPRMLDLLAWPLCIGAALAAIGGRRDGELSARRFLGAGLALWVLAGIWDRGIQIRVPGDGRVGLAYLTCVALALFLFAIARPRRSFDVRLGLGARDLGFALGATAILAAVAVPLGLLLGFLHWEPRWPGLGYGLARLFGLVVFVGLPEELLFRGVFQEAFSRLWTPRVGWAVASVLFGLVHIVKHYPPLNWQFALLATCSGVAYGWVYLRTGKLGAVAVSHGLVNWLWGTWLGS